MNCFEFSLSFFLLLLKISIFSNVHLHIYFISNENATYIRWMDAKIADRTMILSKQKKNGFVLQVDCLLYEYVGFNLIWWPFRPMSVYWNSLLNQEHIFFTSLFFDHDHAPLHDFNQNSTHWHMDFLYSSQSFLLYPCYQ